jgi:CheY-like chemotaxis protein
VAPGRYFEIAVADTGHGMDPDTLLRIFEPFFTTRNPGRGLGLATAYRIVKQSEGYLIPESGPGEGARFRVLLPRHDAEVPAAAPPRANAPLQGGSETVLVVEDEDAVRSLVVRVLRKKGYTVIDAADGEAALLLAREFDDRIDLLISDIVMPRLNGRELVRRLALARPETRVLLMSGYDDAGAPQDTAGPETPFMGKPFTPEELARTVRSVLDA